MANQLSIRLHTRPGDEVMVEETAHIIRYEGGSASALSQVQLCCLRGDRGLLTPDRIVAAIRPKDVHNPPTTLLCLEQTHNFGGGSVYPLSRIQEITKVAKDRGLALHLDGARLWNAVAGRRDVCRGVCEAVRYRVVLSVQRAGGSRRFTDRSTRENVVKLRRLRKMFGGGMRQVGVLAAAGLYALDHHVAR